MTWQAALRLPREHGAWAMVYIPFLLGGLTGGNLSWPLLLLAVAVSAIFFSRESLLVWLRAEQRGRADDGASRLLLVYLAVAAMCGLPLIWRWRFYALLPLAGMGLAILFINGRQALQREDRSLRSEILAICAMTLTAPAAHYVSHGVWSITAVWLWILCVLFFVSSVYHIRLRVLALNPRRADERLQVRQACIFYHSFLFIALLALTLTGSLKLFVLTAFLPALLRTAFSLVRTYQKVNLMRAGVLELIWSVIFLICLAAAFQDG